MNFLTHLPARCLVFHIIMILLAFSVADNAISQTTFELEKMQQKYPDEEVIVYSSDVTFSIETDYRGIDYCRVRETNSTTYLALKDHTRATDVHYYDQYSAISRHNVTGTGFFKNNSSMRCGDFEQDGVFYHDARLCEFWLRFDKAGEYLTVYTEKTYHDIRYFTTIVLGSSYATRRKTVRIGMPEGTDIDFIENNFGNFHITTDTVANDAMPGTAIEYTISDFPGTLRLQNLPNVRCFVPNIQVVFSGFERNNIYTPVLRNLDDLYSWYHSLVQQAGSDDNNLKTFAQELTAGATSDSARLAAIYYWVQDKIRYVAFENGPAAFVPDLPQKVYDKKYGDCKGMAYLCKTLLRHVGFDARLCWVNSNTGCAVATIPSISTHNHMICAVMLHDTILYLDPTRNYSSLTKINESIQGKTCVIENGDTYLLKEIPATSATDNMMDVKNNVNLLNDKLLVKGSITLTGSFKKEFQYYLNHLPVEYKDKLVNYFVTGTDNNYFPDTLTTSSPDSMCRQFDINYSMTVKNKVLDLGDELLLALNFYRFLQNKSIEPKRPLPYDIGSRRAFREELYLEIPEGMMLATLPRDVIISDPKYEFNLSYRATDTTLQCRKELLVKDPVLQAWEIPAWNEAITRVNEFYDEMIILRY